MKAFTISAAAAACALAFALSGCGTPGLAGSVMTTPYRKFAPCVNSSTHIARLPRAGYSQASPGSCIQSLDPFDIAAWVEAPLVSYKERGLQTMVLGCANLVPDARDCAYNGMPGHSATLSLNFNFAHFPAAARVQKAVLAYYVESNASFFRDNADVRARLNIGDRLQAVGTDRTGPPGPAGWITVDITDFAARAINEQRTSASFEISLPCGRDESELTTVRVLKTEPVLVVEYR